MTINSSFDPAERKAYEFNTPTAFHVYAPPHVLSGRDLLPGFALALDRLFGPAYVP